MRHHIGPIDRALTAHALRSPIDYDGFHDGKFHVRFNRDSGRDEGWGPLTLREAHLLCYGLAAGRESVDRVEVGIPELVAPILRTP